MIRSRNPIHQKRWLFGIVLIALFGGGLGVGRAFRADPPRQHEPARASEEEPAPTEEQFAVNDTLRRGDTLTSVLLRQHVHVQEIGQVLERIREDELFSPRALRPGQVVTVVRDDFGTVQRLEVALSPEEIYSFEPRGDSLLASRVDVDREVRLRKFEGRIVSSFDEAVRRSGGDYRLTLKVADVLAYDVDFFTDVREGDWFSLLVEEKFVAGEFLDYGEIVYASYAGERAQTEAIAYRWNDGRDGGHYTPAGEALRKAFLRSPLNYRRISSHFGRRFHPISKVYKHHSGMDFAADAGTPVVALGDGVVEFCGWKGGYGKAVILRHDQRIETLYGHFKGFAKGLRRGDRVRQGDLIGYVGSTGNATGPHLHFEVIDRGRKIDPAGFQAHNQPAAPIPDAERSAFRQRAMQVRELDQELVAGQIVPPDALFDVQPELAYVGEDAFSGLR
jgi:murein DD-endopeptidase MepM/ murein hydrolase activator NlpD